AFASQLTRFGFVIFYQGRFQEAEALFLRARELFEPIGDRLGLLRVGSCLAGTSGEQGRYLETRDRLREAYDLARRVGDTHTLLLVLANLCHLNLILGRYADVFRYAAQQIELASR